ncbi:hypothetical protein B0H11DRAFT_2074523 [Mycena galericulata]|nr:hypothetical protein B0H11DRAFT_2074523 [Mycena galericulata]
MAKNTILCAQVMNKSTSPRHLDWREIAISTPWLWNSFVLSVDLGRAAEGSAVIELFKCWLSRGGGCPLTMLISCHPPRNLRPSGPYTLPESFLDALSHSSARWQDVNLVLPFPDFYRLQADRGLPLLRRLAIATSTDTPPSPPPPPLTLFGNAPVLDDVHLGEGFDLFKVPLPLNQLSYFASRSRTTTAVHYFLVLQQASHLLEISFDLHGLRWGYGDSTVSSPSHVKSNIRSLTVHLPPIFFDLLQWMTCPALETLTISSYMFSSMPSQSLLSFLSRPSPPLRKFVVDFPTAVGDAILDIVQCLLAMPTLASLEIKSLTARTANDIFSRMCDTTSLFLPQLQTLRVEVKPSPNDSSWTYDVVVRMLVARWNVNAGDIHNVAQLQDFGLRTSHFGTRFDAMFNPFDSTVRPPQKPKPAELSQLEALAEAGMMIDLGDDSEDLEEDIWSSLT